MLLIPEAGDLVLKEMLPIALTNENRGQGRHWRKNCRRRKDIEDALRLLGFEREPFPFGVVVWVVRVLGRGEQKFDQSSLGRGNWKEIEDSLVSCGWFVDDSPNFIYETRFFQDDSRRSAGSAIEVMVFRATLAEQSYRLT